MRKNIIFLLSFIWLAVLSIGCSNDTDLNLYSTIKGQVTDMETGEPIQAAAITLTPGGLTIVSGLDGTFEFVNLDPVQYTITVQSDGYLTNRKTVNALAGETLRVDIPLLKQ